MQYTAAILLCLPAVSLGFTPSSVGLTQSVHLRSSLQAPGHVLASKSVRMQAATEEEAEAVPTVTPAAYLAAMPGQLAPLGFFDPVGFTKDKSVSELKRFREAEVTHGRVAMLASLGFLVGENFNPLFGGSISGIAINQFWQVPYPLWGIMAIIIGACETYRAQVGWVEPGYQAENPDDATWFQLRDSYVPGDIGFDPLGLKPSNVEELTAISNKELNNGRLAMFGIAGMVAQELVNGKEILENVGL